MHHLTMTLVAALAGTALAGGPAIDAITRPSANVILKFTRPGLVSKVLVKDGDKVKPGQVVAKLDDEAELAKVAQLKAQSEDQTRIKAAEAQLAQRELDLKKYEQAAKDPLVRAATQMEIEHARLDVRIAKLSLELAKFQQAQDRLLHEEARIRVNRMRLISPIAGQVEDLAVEQGESVDALEEVLRIVKVDPLWINVAVPMSQARRLKRGDPVNVKFAGSPKAKPGKIIHIPAEADAASRTLKVRVEVPNPTGQRAAGEHVDVTFDGSAAPKIRTRTRSQSPKGPERLSHR